MVNYFVLSFVLIGVSIGMLVLLALNRLVIMPLSKLSSEVAEINPSTINEVSVEIPGNDELSGLSKDIDKMLETLRDYQNRIKETERMVSIGATATMVGHDLRNPLQVVFMLTDLIQKRILRLQGVETLDPELENLERLTVRIKDQAAYMNKVVSDLQGLTTGISLEIEKMDVIQLIYKVLESITLGENIEEKIIFEEDFPMIYADRTKLRRVFTNLITNAVQAMKGEGELVIRGHRVEDQVYVSVIDTGDGIAEEYMDKIFDPLFTTKAKGTGLGLTVCKLITESHGGDIEVKSYPGSGSRFTVILPIHNSQDDVNQIQEKHIEYTMPQGHILPSCL
ncbi:MAG: ATP-binding protein [Candidatus Bathyarchaeota archaeon]